MSLTRKKGKQSSINSALILLLLLVSMGIIIPTFYWIQNQQTQINQVQTLGTVACLLPLAFGGTSDVNSVSEYDVIFKFTGTLNYVSPEDSIIQYSVYDTFGNLLATGDDFGLLMRNTISEVYCDLPRGAIFLSSGIYWLNSSHSNDDYGFAVKTGIKITGANPSSTAILVGANYTQGAILIPDETWNVFIEEIGFVEMPDVFSHIIVSGETTEGIGGIFIKWCEFFYIGGISIFFDNVTASGIEVDHCTFTSQRTSAIWIDAVSVSNVQITNDIINFVHSDYWNENVTTDTDLGYGISFTMSSTDSILKDIIIAETNIREAPRNGILVSGAERQGYNVTTQIDTVNIYGCGIIANYSGIMLDTVGKVICINVISEGALGYGIEGASVTFTIVKGAILYDNGLGAIKTDGFDQTCILDNYLPAPEI